jgi:hypothetical protein
MKRLTVKPKVVTKKKKKKKKRVENAPHWTHAGTIAERRKALDNLTTNRQFANEVQANRIRDHVTNLQSERDRLASLRDLRRPNMQFYARRHENITRQIPLQQHNANSLQGRPALVPMR